MKGKIVGIEKWNMKEREKRKIISRKVVYKF